MKGVNSFDENGYWSRYSNDNWSVCKIYDDVLRYEYTLSGESFDALEVVDKLASLESQLASTKARLAEYEWIPVSERLPEEGEIVWLWDGNNLGMGYYLIFSGCFMDRDTPLRSIKPTHWMPLPEAPKEDE